jgi:hypothetical protein
MGDAAASSLVLLTPWAALVGLAFAAPLAALALRERRDARLRSLIGLRAPGRARASLRALGLVALAAVVAATAAQPALRDVGGERMRTDAEIYLAFDVSRSMLASATPRGANRLDRAIDVGKRLHAGLTEFPTGVATITNRMMPLLFPIPDRRGVTAVLERSVAIAQPAPARLTTPRATQLGAMTLAANRTYFGKDAERRALIVLSDLDTDGFGLDGTLAALRRSRIEPFLVRVAAPGELIFDPAGRPEPYRSSSTLAVSMLRSAGWRAYESTQVDRAIADVRAHLGAGPARPSGVVRSQRMLAPVLGLAALALVALLTVPSLVAGLRVRQAATGGGRSTARGRSERQAA